ncbi:MAG: hypothetical protein HC862_04405 [Scytonema sp. RU_4_4]|nr:hypothetical protein [Scytonema sp. RU_4_4]
MPKLIGTAKAVPIQNDQKCTDVYRKQVTVSNPVKLEASDFAYAKSEVVHLLSKQA